MSFLADGVRVEGLEEFQRGLRELQERMPETARNVGFSSAKKTILLAVPNVPEITGATVQSLIAIATNHGGISEGGSTVEHYAWLELGGRSGRRLSNRRPFVSKGRYIVPAYEENKELIGEALEEELIKAVKLSGLDIDSV